MKTLLNLFNRTANAVKISRGGARTTKHLFAIVTLLLTFGVGNMWAGTKRIYFDYSAVSSDWPAESARMRVHCWGGDVAGADYDMSAVAGQSNLIYADIDEGHTSLCFFRQDPKSGDWWNQTQDWGTIGSNNRFKIKNQKGDYGSDKDKYLWADTDAGTRWAQSASIDGLLNPKNPYLQAFNGDGEFTATLAAHTTYEFKILDGTTMYGINNHVWTSSVSEYTLKSGEYQVRLCTSVAGTYTFTWDGTNHKLSVAYPEVDHPSIDYCYVIKYDSWGEHHNIHLWNGSSTLVGEWNAQSTIQGTESPGTELYNTFEYNETNYFYISPANFANFLVSKNGDGTDRSGDLTSSEGYGKYRSWASGDGWQWRTFTVRIQLENNGANVGEKGTEYVDVAFNSDALDDDIEVPVKDGYTFGGYYTEDGGAGTQLISAAGEWTTSAVEDYLDASHHWIHAGMSTTLYAKWTEDKHTVNVAVSPAGAGSVQVNSSNVSTVTNVGISTKAAEMTPFALPGWKFKEWQATSNVQMDLVNYHSDYQQGTDNKMKINATADAQTITAVFEPRYYLVGKIWDDSADGGMPGWDNYNKPFKVVTTSPVLDTCKLTLSTNTSFYIEVRDKADGYSYGKSSETLEDNETLTFTDKDNKVFVYSNGGTEYTFKITGIDGNGHPTVSVERPYQVNVGRKRVDIDGNDHEDNIGGTVAMSYTSSGDPISNGGWVPYGTSVKYDASAESGYSLAWFTASDYASQFSTDPTFYHIATSTGNGYAKFTEKSTSVTLANDGHGKVQISSTDKTNTTCGVTTTRELTAVPNDGYMFSSWTKTSGDDIAITSTSTNPTTLSGLGAGAASGQTVTANFTAKTYNITLNDDQGGEHNGSATISYDATSLTVTSHAIIDGWMRLGYWNSAGNKVSDADGKLEANVQDYTNSSKEWNHDGDVTLWAHWYRIVTLDKNGGSGDGTIGVDYKGYSSSLSCPTRSGYSVEGFYAEAGCTTKVMNPDGTLVKNVSGYTDSNGKWIHKTADKLYTKWIFIIYRTGDKADDPRAQSTDVESYAGGTISEAIEFRMKVRELDKWYTLCLPFTVSAVKVWEDGEYYDLVPFYRTGGKYYTGDYIIRTPAQTTDFPIADFDNWYDPTSPTAYLPSKNTPYIIQWHDGYFQDKYVSFFGAADQTIPSFSAGSAPSSDNVVNVHGNNSMQIGSVAGAYLLENDYGSSGAWLRAENVSGARTILPFECYILVNSPTRARYRAIRPGMATTDTPTGLETIIPDDQQANKILINGQIYIIRDNKIYTIYGMEVQQ